MKKIMMEMIIKHVLEMMMMTLLPQVKKEGSQSAMRLCMGSRRGFIARIKVRVMMMMMMAMMRMMMMVMMVMVARTRNDEDDDDNDEQWSLAYNQHTMD